MQAATQQTGRGLVLNIRRDDGRVGSAFMQTVATGPLAKAAADMTVALENFAGVVTEAARRLKPEALVENLQAAIRNVLSKPFQALAGVTQDEQRNLTAARARALSVDPETSATAPQHARTHRLWDAADVPGKAKLVSTLKYEGLAALIVSGALDDVPADIRMIAENRYMAARHVVVSGIQANYQKKPDASDPVATGPDIEAATHAAEQALDDMKARQEAIDGIRRSLQNVVTVVEITTDLPVDTAYTLLATGKLPA